jgi:hypothetical protein
MPGKLRQASYQFLELIFRVTLERFENPAGNRLLLLHHDSSLYELTELRLHRVLRRRRVSDAGVGAAESERYSSEEVREA